MASGFGVEGVAGFRTKRGAFSGLYMGPCFSEIPIAVLADSL